MNFAFYVSGNAGRLRKIVSSDKENILSSTRLIISDSMFNLDLTDNLKARKINFCCLDYETLHHEKKQRKYALSNLMLEKFVLFEIDYCFCFGDHILSGELLRRFKNKIINFHPSILPMFPGRRAIDQAAKNGVFVLGNTAHFIDEGIDTGPIIMQSISSINLFDQGGYDAILDIQIKMIEVIFKSIISNKLIIKGNNVYIDGLNYQHTVFFPAF